MRHPLSWHSNGGTLSGIKPCPPDCSCCKIKGLHHCLTASSNVTIFSTLEHLKYLKRLSEVLKIPNIQVTLFIRKIYHMQLRKLRYEIDRYFGIFSKSVLVFNFACLPLAAAHSRASLAVAFGQWIYDAECAKKWICHAFSARTPSINPPSSSFCLIFFFLNANIMVRLLVLVTTFWKDLVTRKLIHKPEDGRGKCCFWPHYYIPLIYV